MAASAAPASAAPTVYLHTYGCQMNVLDSTLVQEQLVAEGYRFVAAPDVPGDEAEVVLLNTCSIRALSEQKVWSFLGRLAHDVRRRERLVVGVLGCMAEREGKNILAKMPHVALLCGPSNLSELPTLLAEARRSKVAQVALSGHTSRRSSTREAAIDSLTAFDYARAMAEVPEAAEGEGPATPRQAYVRITRGCNKFCAFCVVPYTRGPEVHRPPEHLLLEVRRLVERGVREITLLGQTINHYAYKDGGKTTSFADLLALLHDGVPQLARLRFLTSYPRDFTDDALDVMASSPRICPYLHLPAQTGSDRLLKKMNRGYDLACYTDLIARARQKLPRLRLSGDMIVGYPTETDADHEASIRLLREVRYKSCYVFKYSPRSGTVSARRHEDDVPEEVKKARNHALLAVQNEVSLALAQAHVGNTLQVLVEKIARPLAESSGGGTLLQLPRRGTRPQPGEVRLVGRTDGDELVSFCGAEHLVGEIVDVEVHSATAQTLFGAPSARTGAA